MSEFEFRLPTQRRPSQSVRYGRKKCARTDRSSEKLRTCHFDLKPTFASNKLSDMGIQKLESFSGGPPSFSRAIIVRSCTCDALTRANDAARKCGFDAFHRDARYTHISLEAGPVSRAKRMTVADQIEAKQKATAAEAQGAALVIEQVAVDASCTGNRWTSGNLDLLARIIAIIAMGQAAHAARIINGLLPVEPALDHEALRANAKRQLTVAGTTAEQKQVRRYHRDGLIFEAISWAAARQQTGGKALLRDPHVSATTQGLDGLMIEMDAEQAEVTRATIFEDKCSENPDNTFRYKIMPAFKAHHKDARASDLVATAAALLEKAGTRRHKCR